MRVDVLTHTFPTPLFPFNGTFVRDHVDAMRKKHDVCVQFLSPYAIPLSKKWKNNRQPVNDTNIQRLRYLSIPQKAFSDITMRNLISNIKKSLNPETDLFHLQFCYPSGLLAHWLSTVNKPSVITIHGDDFYSSIKRKDLRQNLMQSFSSTKFIIPVGKLLGDDISAEFPEIKDRVIPVHNYFREEHFQLPSNSEKSQARDALKFDKQKTHILTVANMRHKKGIDVLIDAISRNFNSSDLEFHIVGRLPDNAYEKSVRSSIMQKNLHNVHLHGPKGQRELLNYYYAADLFVLPSRNEPFGISILEAAATGLPVVSTHSGGPSEIIHDKIGFLVQPDDPLELSVAIHQALEKLQQFSADHMRQDILKRFGIDRFIKTYDELYKEAVK